MARSFFNTDGTPRATSPTKAHYSNYVKISAPLLRENLKRFWALPVAGIICYFFAGIVPQLSQIDAYDRYWRIIEIAEFSSAAFTIFSVAFPLLASLMMNHYLNRPGSVSVMHSLPITRGKLFFTNFVTQMLMICIPIILTYAVLMLAIPSQDEILSGMNPQYIIYEYPFNLTTGEICTGLLRSLGTMLLLSGFYVTVFNLAAQLTGNSALHFIVSGILAFGPAIATLVIYGVADRTLYGISINSSFFGLLIEALSPVVFFGAVGLPIGDHEVVAFGRLNKGNIFGELITYYIIYFIAFIIFYILGAIAYSKRRNERAGDSIVYKSAERILVTLLSFAGMALGAVLASAIWNVGLPFILGLFIGGIIIFFAAKMAAQKSRHVFGSASWAHLGISFAIALAILASFIFDAFGFVHKVPVPGNIEYVNFSAGIYSDLLGDSAYQSIVQLRGDSIDLVVDYHKDILRAHDSSPVKGFIHTQSYSDYYPITGVMLDYSNGLQRRYSVPAEITLSDKYIRIFDSPEYREAVDIYNWLANSGGIMNIYFFLPDAKFLSADEPAVYSDDIPSIVLVPREPVTLGTLEYTSFLEALNRDISHREVKQYTANPNDITLIITTTDNNRDIYLTSEYVNTMSWLGEHGYIPVTEYPA